MKMLLSLYIVFNIVCLWYIDDKLLFTFGWFVGAVAGCVAFAAFDAFTEENDQ